MGLCPGALACSFTNSAVCGHGLYRNFAVSAPDLPERVVSEHHSCVSNLLASAQPLWHDCLSTDFTQGSPIMIL